MARSPSTTPFRLASVRQVLSIVNIVLHDATGYSVAMFRPIEWLFEWLFESVLGAILRPVLKKARDYGGNLGRTGAGGTSQIILNLFRVGDYGNTLAMCNLGRSAGQDLDVLRAHILMQLGDCDQAVGILTKAVDQEKHPQLAALANCTLGEVYLFQDRIDAAFDAFNTAQKLWPKRGATYRNLAEVWFRRGNREQTLRCARLAVEMENAEPGVTPETKASNLAVALAVLACAVASSSGDVSEVCRLTSKAASHCGGLAVTTVAKTHVYCAIACNLVGDPVKSAEHLELAVRVDPNGAWGRKARRLTAEAMPIG